MGKAKPPARTVRLVYPPNADGIGAFCIALNGKAQFYTFCEIRCDIGGRGFGVHRLGQGELYHVRVGRREDTSCECLGFLRWDHCKHVAGLAALIRNGELPPRGSKRPTPPPTEPPAVPTRYDTIPF